MIALLRNLLWNTVVFFVFLSQVNPYKFLPIQKYFQVAPQFQHQLIEKQNSLVSFFTNIPPKKNYVFKLLKINPIPIRTTTTGPNATRIRDNCENPVAISPKCFSISQIPATYIMLKKKSLSIYQSHGF